MESIKVRRTLFSVLKFERIPRARVGIRTTCFLFIFIYFFLFLTICTERSSSFDLINYFINY